MKHLLQIVLRKYEFFHISYLHSTMVLFKYDCINQCNTNITHLHSTMVLFKLFFYSFLVLSFYIYIPLWSYSNQLKSCTYQVHKRIYIPLWSYSNLTKTTGGQPDTNLHSTMVLFKSSSIIKDMTNKEFTFHYGPIQIIFNHFYQLLILDLHSTMVLFK